MAQTSEVLLYDESKKTIKFFLEVVYYSLFILLVMFGFSECDSSEI
jgi:hypothetical protein